MNQEYKILAKNSALFAVANFGSKILKFLIVPFYTYYLTTSQYGTVDTMTTTISLLSPFVLLGMNEASLRFAMKEDYSNDSIISNCTITVLITSIVGLLLYFPVSAIEIFRGYWWLFYAILLVTSFETMLLYYARGVGKNVVFAIAGVINTIVLLASNIVLLVIFHAGEKGYLLSVFLSSLISAIFIVVSLSAYRDLRLSSVNKNTIIQMLKYSLPLMPNAIMWWVMNSSDRYVILHFLGVSAAGIYAVSYKMPSIMSTFAGIFHQAWQLSAIRQNGREDSEKFYASVFDVFCIGSFVISAWLILLVKPIFSIFDSSYFDAWKYAPFLILGAVFSGFSGFVGVNYTVSEKTLGAFMTSALGAVINITMNIVLTPFIGMYGTAIATFISFYVLWIARTIQTQKFVDYKIDYLLVHKNLALVIVESLLLIFNTSYIYIFVCAIISVLINIRYLRPFLKDLVRIIRKC